MTSNKKSVKNVQPVIKTQFKSLSKIPTKNHYHKCNAQAAPLNERAKTAAEKVIKWGTNSVTLCYKMG